MKRKTKSALIGLTMGLSALSSLGDFCSWRDVVKNMGALNGKVQTEEQSMVYKPVVYSVEYPQYGDSCADNGDYWLPLPLNENLTIRASGSSVTAYDEGIAWWTDPQDINIELTEGNRIQTHDFYLKQHTKELQ